MYFSQISLFEIAIKLKVGKLPQVLGSLTELIDHLILNNFSLLNLETSHILAYEKIPLFLEHRDPFDRILTAQGIVEGLPIVTIDPQFQQYSDLVKVVW